MTPLRMPVALLACAVTLVFALGGGPAFAQPASEGSAGVEGEPVEGSAEGDLETVGEVVEALPVQFDLNVELETSFFAQDELGFDGDTFSAVVNDASHWIGGAVDAAIHVRDHGTQAVISNLGPWIAIAVLGFIMFLGDRRAKRKFVQLAATLQPRRPDANPQVLALRRALVAGAGKLVMPTVGWMLSYVPVQGMFDSATWTVALSQALALLLVLRAIIAAADVFFRSDVFEFPEESAEVLRRIVVSSTGAILFFVALSGTISITGYRSDAFALSERLLRLSITLLSVRVLVATGHIAKLLPEEGSAAYLRFRSLFVRYVRHFVVLSLVLLSLWTLGFTRAATTVLLRSYGIVALLVGGALALRWFDRYSGRPSDGSLAAALMGTVDSFARFCINLAFGAAILGLLGLLNPVLTALDSLGVSFGNSSLTVLSVLTAVFVIMLAVLLSRVTRVVLEHTLYPAMEVDVGAAYAANIGIHYFILVASFGLALIALGIDLGALTVFAGALGVGIGFGLQDFARNLVSGLALLFGKIIRKGDLVTVGGEYNGIVEEIGGRMVRIRTRDNTDLVIPASEVVGSALVNWTHGSPVVRIRVPVGASYSSDPNEVREALLDAAARFDHVLRDPAPDVWFTEFGDNSINFMLLVWISAASIDPTVARGKLMFHVWDAMAERNIEIPFPQRDLHLRSVDPALLERLQGGLVPSGPEGASEQAPNASTPAKTDKADASEDGPA